MISVLKHTLYDALRFVGMRDRLRCPKCGSVGTWKPHGGIFDREDVRKVRRWLCKWCGHYVGIEGVRQATLGPHCWHLSQLPYEGDADTPQKRCNGAWPWRG